MAGGVNCASTTHDGCRFACGMACTRVGLGACNGLISGPGADDVGGSPTVGRREVPPADRAALVAPGGIRRLTAAELDLTIRDLLDDDASDAALVLPEDVRTPFDNDAQTQIVSEALIGGVELLASDAVQRLVDDDGRFERVVGCAPDASMSRGVFAHSWLAGVV